MVSINSILDNVKEKVTNPFVGTFIVVWLVRNWELVYTIFNFEKNASLYNKKKFIREFYKDKDLLDEFITNFLISLSLLLIGYVFVIISRVILNVVYHNIIPYFNSKFVSKLVVNKTRFDTVKKARDDYFQKIVDLEEERISLEQSNSLLKTKNIENESKINIYIQDKEILERDLSDAKGEILNFKSSLQSVNKKLKDELDSFNNSRDKFNLDIKELNIINSELIEEKEYLDNLLADFRNSNPLLYTLQRDNFKETKPYTVDKEKKILTINLKIPEYILEVGQHLKNRNQLKLFYDTTFDFNVKTLDIYPVLNNFQIEEYLNFNLIERVNDNLKLTQNGLALHMYKPYFDSY